MSEERWLRVGAHVKVDGVNDDYVGEIVELLPGRVVILKNASWVRWISKSGRLHKFIADGKAEGMEIEFVGDQAVAWEAVTLWPHPLPLRRH